MIFALGAPIAVGIAIYLFGLSAWLLIIGVWIALVPLLLGLVDSELSALKARPGSSNNGSDQPLQPSETQQSAPPRHHGRHD